VKRDRSYFIFHIKLKTNQGRFVLSSSGDLQIVQLHRTDSGTYVCVAYNGIGNSVEREIKLTVDGKFSN
jgi:papilin